MTKCQKSTQRSLLKSLALHILIVGLIAGIMHGLGLSFLSPSPLKELVEFKVLKKLISPSSPTHSDQRSMKPSKINANSRSQLTSSEASSDPALSIDNNTSKTQITNDTVFLNELRRQLQAQLIYPRSARSLNQQGSVEISFNLDQTGALSSAHVTQPSAFQSLNQEALDVITRVGQLDLSHVQTSLPASYFPLTIRLPIEFKLD